MRFAHISHAALLAAALSVTFPACVAAKAQQRQHMHLAPRHIVSAFLCTDEYIFRLVPRERITGLSYLSADTHPIVSTIAEQVKNIPLVRASAEQVLALQPD